MPNTVNSPNCHGPVQAETDQETAACVYCGFRFPNEYFKPRSPRPAPAVPRPIAKPKKLLWLVVLAPLLVVGATAAFLLQARGQAAQMAATAARVVAPAMSIDASRALADPQLASEEKLDAYIKCLLLAYPRAEESVARYRSWLKDPAKGPTCKERYITWGLYEMYDNAVPNCTEWIDTANAAPPRIPQLEQAASRFVAAAAKVAPVMKEASNYYGKKLYATDDCARGKELHPRLMTAFSEMSDAERILRAIIAESSRGSLDRCIERTRQRPELIAGFHWATLVKLAGQAVDAYRTEARKPKPDLEVIKKHIAGIEAAAQALKGLDDEDKEAAGYHWSYDGDIDAFVQGTVAFLQSKGGKKLGSSERFFLRNGSSRDSLSGTFENLVVLFNKVVFDFANLKQCPQLLPCSAEACPAR